MNQIFQTITNFFQEIKFKIGDTTFSLSAILKLIICLSIVLFLTRFLKKFLKHNLLIKLGIDEGNRESIATIISYGVGSLCFVIILQTIGFNISSIAFIVGGLGVGIGFGLQELTRNFISGLTLLFERIVKVGDFVEFDNLSGYVKEIAMRSTIIQTRDGADVIVPNSDMVDNRLINWSYDNFIGRIKVSVSVAYNTDPLLVTENLLKAAYCEPNILDNPPPKVMFMGFGDSALSFELWIWINRYDHEPEIRSSLNFAIEYFLRQSNINIPFPQRDLWIKNPEAFINFNQDKYSNQIEKSSQEIFKPIALSKEVSIIEMLKSITYFQSFNELDMRKLIEVGYRKKLYNSEILFEENSEGDAFYIILSGQVEIFVSKINKHLTFLKDGEFFGELSLMLGIPRTATVKAVEETILFVINRQGFEKLLKQSPQLSEIIINELSQRKQELLQREKYLKELGLLDHEKDDQNLVQWIRKRWKKIFNIH